MSNEKELRKTFKEYKQYYLKGMNWKTKETFKEETMTKKPNHFVENIHFK
jgi:hypothetical protein